MTMDRAFRKYIYTSTWRVPNSDHKMYLLLQKGSAQLHCITGYRMATSRWQLAIHTSLTWFGGDYIQCTHCQQWLELSIQLQLIGNMNFFNQLNSTCFPNVQVNFFTFLYLVKYAISTLFVFSLKSFQCF